MTGIPPEAAYTGPGGTPEEGAAMAASQPAQFAGLPDYARDAITKGAKPEDVVGVVYSHLPDYAQSAIVKGADPNRVIEALKGIDSPSGQMIEAGKGAAKGAGRGALSTLAQAPNAPADMLNTAAHGALASAGLGPVMGAMQMAGVQDPISSILDKVRSYSNKPASFLQGIVDQIIPPANDEDTSYRQLADRVGSKVGEVAMAFLAGKGISASMPGPKEDLVSLTKDITAKGLEYDKDSKPLFDQARKVLPQIDVSDPRIQRLINSQHFTTLNGSVAKDLEMSPYNAGFKVEPEIVDLRGGPGWDAEVRKARFYENNGWTREKLPDGTLQYNPPKSFVGGDEGLDFDLFDNIRRKSEYMSAANQASKNSQLHASSRVIDGLMKPATDAVDDQIAAAEGIPVSKSSYFIARDKELKAAQLLNASKTLGKGLTQADRGDVVDVPAGKYSQEISDKAKAIENPRESVLGEIPSFFGKMVGYYNWKGRAIKALAAKLGQPAGQSPGQLIGSVMREAGASTHGEDVVKLINLAKNAADATATNRQLISGLGPATALLQSYMNHPDSTQTQQPAP